MSTTTQSTVGGWAYTPETRAQRPGDPFVPARVLLSVREAAALLGIGRTLMYELLDSGAVESLHVGRLHKVPVDAVMDFVTRQRRRDPASGDST